MDNYEITALLNRGIVEFNLGEDERIRWKDSGSYSYPVGMTSHYHDAYRTFEEVLRKDPNHSDARRLLEMAQQRLPYKMDSRL